MTWQQYNAIKQQAALPGGGGGRNDPFGLDAPPPPSEEPDNAKLGAEHAGGLNMLTSGDMFVPSDSILGVSN